MPISLPCRGFPTLRTLPFHDAVTPSGDRMVEMPPSMAPLDRKPFAAKVCNAVLVKLDEGSDGVRLF